MNVANQNPRFDNDNILRWYEGTTWSMSITINLEDDDGNPIIIQDGETVDVTFVKREYDTTPVKKYVFENIVDNTVVVNMDETSTLLFPRGMYYFGIVYNGLNIVPIVSSNKVIVEALID